MIDLVKRYLIEHHQLINKTEKVTEDDVIEVKQDIKTFRFEIMDILKTNGMDILDYTTRTKGMNFQYFIK